MKIECLKRMVLWPRVWHRRAMYIYIYIQDTIIIISHLVSRGFWNIGLFFSVATRWCVHFAWKKCSQSHCSYISIWVPFFYTFFSCTFMHTFPWKKCMQSHFSYRRIYLGLDLTFPWKKCMQSHCLYTMYIFSVRPRFFPWKSEATKYIWNSIWSISVC